MIAHTLLKFQLVDDSPYVIFSDSSNDNKFKQDNPTLYSKIYEKFLRLQEQKEIKGSPPNMFHLFYFNSFNLIVNKLIAKKVEIGSKIKIFDFYENYIINVLNLYSVICRGRNKKAIKFIE